MLDINRIKTPTLALFDQGLFAFANLVLQIIIARSVDAEEFGAYAIGSTFFFLAALAHQTFIVEPMFVFSGRKYSGSVGPYFKLLRQNWSLIYGTATCVVGLLMSAIACRAGSPLITHSLLAFSFASPFVLYFWILRRMAFLLHRIDLAVVGGLIYAITLVAGSGLIYAAGWMSAWVGILLTAVAAIAASITIQLNIAWPKSEANTPKGVFAQHFRYGRWAFGSEVLNWIIVNGPILILPIWFGLSASGILRILNLMFMPLQQTVSAMTSMLLRRFAAAGNQMNMLKEIMPFYWILLAGAAVYSAAVTIFGPWLAPLLFGSKYEIGRELVLLGGAATTFFVSTQAFFVAMRATERSQRVLIVHSVVLSLIAFQMGILSSFGIVGVLIAQCVSWFIGMATAFTLLHSDQSKIESC